MVKRLQSIETGFRCFFLCGNRGAIQALKERLYRLLNMEKENHQNIGTDIFANGRVCMGYWQWPLTCMYPHFPSRQCPDLKDKSIFMGKRRSRRIQVWR